MEKHYFGEQMDISSWYPETMPLESNDYKWSFKDYPEKNGIKVFSCFSCAGGSTMGYKLAGCDVIGCCEIDPNMNEIYVKNHHPKYNYLMDIREFNKLEDLPEELYNLDILDGSPPCTTFSMVGQREKTWGKKKAFREGQKEQTLDDLSFVFIETVKKLKPKMVVMENVEGILLGEAIQYAKRIYNEFKKIGYDVRHYLLKGETMGVPQTRHRVFFIAARNDLCLDFDNLKMDFHYRPIPYGEFKGGDEIKASGLLSDIVKQAKEYESFVDARERLYNSRSGFSCQILRLNKVMPTQIAGHSIMWTESGNHPSIYDLIIGQTFPLDFDFITKNYSTVQYVCGMSVPPVMMKRVAERLIYTGIFTNDNLGGF